MKKSTQKNFTVGVLIVGIIFLVLIFIVSHFGLDQCQSFVTTLVYIYLGVIFLYGLAGTILYFKNR